MGARLLIGSFLIFTAMGATAQVKRTMTVEEAVRTGLENSKALRQSMNKVAYADARAGEVNASTLPSLRFGGSYTRLSDVPPFAFDNPFPTLGPPKIILAPSVLNNYSLRLSLQHPLFTGFRLDAARNAADATVDATDQEFNRDRSDLVYNVKSSYWGLFRAREFRKLADEYVEQIKAHLNDVKNLMDQGMATNNDMLAAQVQLSDAQLRQIDAKNGVRLAQIGLDNTLGIPLTTEVEISSDISHSPRDFAPLDSLVRKGIDARPEVKAMEARVRAGEAGVLAARSGWWPQITLTGNYYYQRPNPRIQPTQDTWKDTWDVGLNVSLDIWNWGATIHQTDQAQAQLAQVRDAFGQIQDGVTLDVTQAYLTLEQARERIEVVTTGLSRAEENFRVTTRRYKEGLVINSDMLDAQYSLNLARTNYTQALVDFELAQARLAKATGE